MGATMGKSGGNLLDSLPSTQGTLHVVMLGLDSAGKTTALYRLKFDQYLNTVPTIGFNCEKVRGAVGKAKGAQFLVWDVGGQEKLRPLWRSYTRCTDGIVFVVDSVDVERMEEAKMELMRTAKCPDNQGVPVLILANKQDLPGAREPKELEKLLGLHELSPLYPILSTTSSGGGSGGGGGGGSYIDGGTTQISNSSQQNHLVGGVVTTVGISSSVNTSSRGGCGSSSNNNSDNPITPTSTSSSVSSIAVQQHHKSSSSSSSACGGTTSVTSSSTPNLHHHQQQQTPTLIHNPITTSTTHEKIVASPTVLTNLISLSPTTATTTTTVSTTPMSNTITTTIIHHQQQQPFKGWYIQPACAITGEGLQEGLEALYEMILKKRKMNKSNKKKR